MRQTRATAQASEVGSNLHSKVKYAALYLPTSAAVSAQRWTFTPVSASLIHDLGYISVELLRYPTGRLLNPE